MSFSGWAKGEIGYLSRDLILPLRVLAISISGVGLAWLWLHDRILLGVIIVVIVLIVGWMADAVGRRRLPDKPVSALAFLELWLLVPSVLSAAAAGALIVLMVKLTVPEGTGTVQKELTGAILAALGGFLTGGLFSWYKDEKDETLANRVQTLFQSKYERQDPTRAQKPGIRYLPAESDAERLVFSESFQGIEGWGRSARWERAKRLATQL
jgi:hypothetical protein